MSYIKQNHTDERGALMLEVIALLGLMTLISPMLYRQIADRNNEVDDVTQASIIRTMRDGLNSYILANDLDIKKKVGLVNTNGELTDAGKKGGACYKKVAAACTKNFTDLTEAQKSAILANMPPGLDKESFEAGGEYSIQFFGYSVPGGIIYKGTDGRESASVAEEAPPRPVVTAMIVSKESKDSQRRAARIASLIGVDGGIVTQKAGETAGSSQNAYGTLGSWKMAVGNKVQVPENSVVALAAYDSTGKNILNRLNADLDADGHDITNADYLQGRILSADERVCIGDNCDDDESSGDASIDKNTIRLMGETFAETPENLAEMTIRVDKIKPYGLDLLTVEQKTQFDSSVNMQKDLRVEGGVRIDKNLQVDESAQIKQNLLVGVPPYSSGGPGGESIDEVEGNLYSANIFGEKLQIGHKSGGDGEGDSSCISFGPEDTGSDVLKSAEGTIFKATITNDPATSKCVPYFEVTKDRVLVTPPVKIKNTLTVEKDAQFGEDLYTDDAIYAQNKVVIGGLERENIPADKTGFEDTYLLDKDSNLPLNLKTLSGTGDYDHKQAGLIVDVDADKEGKDIYLHSGRIMTGKKVETTGQDKQLKILEDGEVPYYQIDPAYTSIMNDIRLTSRGGARLSQILPNYISKGMYYLTNTYSSGGWPCTAETCPAYPFEIAYPAGSKNSIFGGSEYSWDEKYKDGDMSKCDTTACVAHPYMGRVPAPGYGDAKNEGKCPPGYAPLITLLPTAFEMSKISHLIVPMSHTHELYIDLITDAQGNVSGAVGRTSNPRSSSGESILMKYEKGTLTPYDPQTSTEEAMQVPYTILDADRTFAHDKKNNEQIEIKSSNSSEVTGTLINSNMIGQTDNWLVTLLQQDPPDADKVTEGWHVAMGLISRVYGDSTGSYVWNPQGVAPNTMTLFAQTYCVFDPSVFAFDASNTADHDGFPVPKYRDRTGKVLEPSK